MLATVSHAWTYLRTQGPIAFGRRVLREIPYQWYRYTKDRQWAGRTVELLGNRWRLNGCVFSLDNPSIQTKLKSRFLNRSYEAQERRLVHEFLLRDIPAVEFGASVGVVSCVTNALLRSPSQHVVVEANPELLPTLEKNRSLNKSAFTVIHAALAYGTDSVEFSLHERFVGGSVERKTDRHVHVPSINLQTILEKSQFDTINLIVDVEGAEIGLIEHEGELLQKRVAMLIIEMHPTMIVPVEVANAAHARLVALGFRREAKDMEVYAYRNLTLP